MASPMLLVLLLPLLLVGGATALFDAAATAATFEPLLLTRCPRGNLTLTVPSDLPLGSALFAWNPAQLSVRSSREEYRRNVNRALRQVNVSAGARAFLSDVAEDVFSLDPAASRAVLARPLLAGGSYGSSVLVEGHFGITCTPLAADRAGSKFSLNLRLVRAPMRRRLPDASRGAALAKSSATLGWRSYEPLQLTRCPRGSLTLTIPADLPLGSALLIWDPAQLSLRSSREQYKRNVNRALSEVKVSAAARAFLSDVAEDVFSVCPATSQAVLVRALPAGGSDGSSDLVEGRFGIACTPLAADRAGSKFSLNLRLDRAPKRPTVMPSYRLWRRRVTHIRVADGSASDDAKEDGGHTTALAGARIGVDLGALLARRVARVRLVGSSDPARVRLVPAASRLLLDLPPTGHYLAVTLEAVDAEGRAEATVLRIAVVHEPATAPPSSCAGLFWRWWPAPLAVGAVALCLACVWAVLHWRLRNRVRVGVFGGVSVDPLLVTSSPSSLAVKPQFV